MKGFLHKVHYDWVIRFKKPDRTYTFEILLHPDSLLEYGDNLSKYENKEVDFEIVWGLNPYDHGNECELAKLMINEIKLTWNDLADAFAESRAVDLEDSKLSFIPFLNWLKQNYHVPLQLEKSKLVQTQKISEGIDS